MHYFDDVTLPTFSATKPVKTWSLAGYREFCLHYWFKGPPGAIVYMELVFNGIKGTHREIKIGRGGTAIAMEVFPVAAPDLLVVLYNPSAPMEGRIRVYAACCGG